MCVCVVCFSVCNITIEIVCTLLVDYSDQFHFTMNTQEIPMDLFESAFSNVAPIAVGAFEGTSRSQCNWCDYTSGSQILMSTHERALHSAEMSASFFCTFCPAKLSSAVGLHLHTSRKHGVSHLPGWPTPSTRGKRSGEGIRPMSERNLGDGWVVGDTLEGSRVQYKADFYVNAFHTVGEGYVRLEKMGKQCSSSNVNSNNLGLLHELNRVLAESTSDDHDESYEGPEDLRIDEETMKRRMIEQAIAEEQQRQSLKIMAAEAQQMTSVYTATLKETFRDGKIMLRTETRPPKEYFCASCSFRTKYSSSLRRHTAKMHRAENKKLH